jgi:hypothetical protein
MRACSGERAEAVAEEYLRGDLPQAEALSFEEHCLECDACFEHVRVLEAVRDTLVEKHWMKPPVWAAVTMAAAAALIVAVAVQHWYAGTSHLSRPQSVSQVPVEKQVAPPQPVQSTRPEPDAPKTGSKPTNLALLADKSLPPFRETQLRGASAGEHFESGMRAYAANDCATAIGELKRVPRSSDRGEAVVLYAGACQYQLRNLAAARASLTQLASNQDSPLTEVARYYLAQVELAQNHAAEARRWLNEVVSLHGDYEARASAQLKKIN